MITRASIFIKRSSKCNTSPTTTSRLAGLAVSTSATLRIRAEVEVEVEVGEEAEVEARMDDMSLSTEAAAGMTDGIMKLKSLTLKTSW